MDPAAEANAHAEAEAGSSSGRPPPPPTPVHDDDDDEIAQENRLHELQSRIDELERLHEADQAELRALRQSEEGANSTLQDVKAENDRLKQQAEDDRQSAAAARSERERVEAEKRELLDALARSDADKAALEESLDTLRTAHAATQASLRSLEATFAATNENERSYKLRLQALEGELTIVKKDRDWNHAELERVSDEAARERREKNTQISSLQTQLDGATQSAESATASLAHLRTSHTSLEGRLDDALTRVSTLTAQLADAEASFRAEIATSQRLNELLQQREEDTKARLDEVEREWDAAQKQMQVIKDEYEAELSQERARADALDNRVREMREFADRLAEHGGALPLTLTTATTAGMEEEDVFGLPVQEQSSSPSTSAATLSLKLQKAGGRSYTEIYSAYVQMQHDLNMERAESKRLSENLQDILQEMKNRAPLIKEQRQEYERTLLENNELSIALAKALEDKDEHARSAKAQKQAAEHKAKEAAILSQQLNDTSLQVRALTRRVAVLEDPTILDRSAADDDGGDLAAVSADVAAGAQDFITAHLVTFRTIDQLQKQNQDLLRIVRELGKKMESEEEALRERVDRAENEAVEEAHEVILQLKEELQSLRAQAGALQRERDMLRQVLKNRGGGAHTSPRANGGRRTSFNNNGTAFDGVDLSLAAEDGQDEASTNRAALEDVQKNFEAYKREMVVDNQTLRDDLANARREASQLQIELARANANRELLEERYKTLSDANTRQDREVSAINKRNIELQTNLARQDDATRRVTEELLELKSSLDRARHESLMLKAEREVWKNVEARLTEDNANLTRERTHLSDLMSNLQSMHNELERSGSEARSRLDATISRLQTELDSTKERLSQESETSRQISLRKELETKEFQSRIDKLTADYHDAREVLLATKNRAERAEERSEAMARQIAAYEEKLAVYEGRRSSGGATNGGTSSSISREQQLESQVADLRGQLSTARLEVEQANAHVEQYKAIARAHEETLAELNGTYDEYKRSMEAQLAETSSEIEALQERVASLTNDLTTAGNDNSELHKQLETQQSQFQQEQQANLDTIANLRQVESQMASIRENARKDLAAQSRRAAEAHEKYQAEVLGHAEDVKTLNALKNELAAERRVLAEVRMLAESAQANLASSEGSWNAQKDVLQRELEEQKRRCDDLIAQNNLLHSHLESVSSQAAKIQQAAAAASSSTEGSTTGADGAGAGADGDTSIASITSADAAKSTEELQAVIRFVRREKDVAELRLELSRQQEARLRQELEHANRQLDDKTLELSNLRQQAADTTATATQHAELLDKIQSLNLLRESNETLRREANQQSNRAQTLQQRLREAESQLLPLREQVRVLTAEVEARDRNIKMLEEDNARWKTRTQQILQKYERIDPAELAQLKEELEQVRAQLEEVQRARDAAESRANAISIDLNDANTRAESSTNRFKSIQETARRQRDALVEAESRRSAMQAEIDQLNASKVELEKRISEAQAASSAASEQAAQQLQSEKDEAIKKAEADKEELAKAKEELEAAKKKMEEDNAGLTRRNTILLNDNKRFRAQIIELEQTKQNLTQNIEQEVQKRLAENPAAAATESSSGGVDEAAVQSKLKEQEERLTKEREMAVQEAVSETTSRLKAEFEQEKAKLSAASTTTIKSEEGAGESGSSSSISISEEEIQKRVEAESAQKIQAALKAKEEEHGAALQAKVAEATKQIEQAKKQYEQQAQARITNLTKNHTETIHKLQKEHEEKLSKAIAEAKAQAQSQAAESAANANKEGLEAGEVSSSGNASAEDVQKAVEEALQKKEEEHAKALKAKTEEVAAKEKKQYEIRATLVQKQVAALRKEVSTLKARLGESSGPPPPSATSTTTNAAGAAGSPVPTPASAFPSTSTTAATTSAIKTPNPSPAAATGATVGAVPKGLSIAGRSQSQGGGPSTAQVAKPATTASPGVGVGLSILGSASPAQDQGGAAAAAADGSAPSPATTTTTTTTTIAGRGRGGRGRARGGAIGAAGRGRGGTLVNAALSSAVSDATSAASAPATGNANANAPTGATKRAREEDGSGGAAGGSGGGAGEGEAQKRPKEG